MLFSLQILLEIFLKKSGVINFASQMNFKQIFESLFFMNKKQILDTYALCNNYLKYSFVNFLSIFFILMRVYSYVLSSSYDG